MFSTDQVLNELTNSPSRRPRVGSTKDAPNILSLGQASAGAAGVDDLPAMTLRNALPEKPFKNLPTNKVWMFCATAQGISAKKVRYC